MKFITSNNKCFLFLLTALGLSICHTFAIQKIVLDPKSSISADFNLGDQPWLFTKQLEQKVRDLTLNKVLFVYEGEDKSKLLTMTLDSVSQINEIRLSFSNTNIGKIRYVLLGSKDQRDWEIINDRADNENGEKMSLLKSSVVSNTANTVGFVEKAIGSYTTVAYSGKLRYVKAILKDVEDISGRKIIPEDISISVFSKLDVKHTNAAYNGSIDDSKWESVGIPHCYNDMDTYLNSNNMNMWRGDTWYRKHLFIDSSVNGKKLFLNFGGVNVAAGVYVNGQFIPGYSSVNQLGEVTHVGGFLPFSVDISKAVHFGEENIIAVKVSNAQNSFFVWPTIADYEGFGMSWGGIVCPVHLQVANEIYIPQDAASFHPENWGSYFATTTANPDNATIQMSTKVVNEGASTAEITITNELLDATGKSVSKITSKQIVDAGQNVVFNHQSKIKTPHLWFPNNSTFGKPYLYSLVTTLSNENNVLDVRKKKVGIRQYSWDGNYCYMNGKKHLMVGYGNRNTYPALGSAVPDALQWNDVRLMAEAGANCLRVGHVPATEATLNACDEYGIMVMQNSGDNEWALKNEPALTYKKDYDREVMLAQRNHPSIAVWESNNGLAKDGEKYLPEHTQTIADKWDSLGSRIVSTRDVASTTFPKDKRLMVGYTNRYQKVTGSPSLNVEVYGAFWDGRRSINISRDDYANEKEFTDWYVMDYYSNLKDTACGWLDWMLAETQGEGYTIYLNGRSKQKSLGSCAMDGNRFPKLKYQVFKNAIWHDFNVKPGVALQTSWNLKGVQDVDAWSNCPKVALYLNNKKIGECTPNPITKRCTWKQVKWEPGTIKVLGLNNKNKVVCSDSRSCAGKPHHIELSLENPIFKGENTYSPIKANGSDVAIITATIVDKDGNWCVDATNNLHFDVKGEGVYKGSYNFYVDETKPLHYHAPADKELQAEGGLMRVAIKSTFMEGKVKVTADADGIIGDELVFTTTSIK